jgi:GNAT superfamily N-acetyltransferase
MLPPASSARIVSILEITSASAADLVAQARTLLLEYGQFVASHPVATHFCLGTLQNEAEHLPASYAQQGGGCLIAHVDGQPAGFVAWRNAPGPLTADAWELKRLWVREHARGFGLGRALTQHILDRAMAADRTAVYLDTMPEVMPAAHHLYIQMGFTPCAPYNGNHSPELTWLVKYLIAPDLRQPTITYSR